MKKPENLVSLIVYAVLLVVSIVVGLVSGAWANTAPSGGIQINLGNIARILALIFGTLLVERLLVWLLGNLKAKSNRGNTLLKVTANLLKYIAAIVIVCGVLALLGVDVVTIVAGLGIIALIIGFGAESLISDVVTGMFILLDNQYNVGDIIEVGGFRGTVSEVGIRTTSLVDVGGNVKIINNSEMKNILNRSDNVSKGVADFPVPYGTDIAALEAKIPAICEAIRARHADVMLAAPEYMGVQQLDKSSVNLRFVVPVAEKDIFNGARILNRELLVEMRAAGVECPFTQIDIHQK